MHHRLALVLCCVALVACKKDSGGTSDLATGGGEQDLSIVVVGGDGGVLFDPCTDDKQPGFDPVEKGLSACCDGVAPAHCIAKSTVIQSLVSQLATCSDDTVCMPDAIITAGANYVPKTCTSTLGGLEGACLSKCIPLVANNPQTVLLAQDDCVDGDLCIPCTNPLDGTSTGACDLIELLCVATDGGIMPGDGGTTMCPYEGPPLLNPLAFPDCDPVCGGSHCLPATLIPAAQQSLLASCNGGAGFCAPDKLIETAGNFVPKACRSIANSEGRCLSTCLAPVAAQAALLPDADCDAGEKCVPCFDPTNGGAATGACTLACDAPKEPAVTFSCANPPTNLLDPATLPDCAPACGGAHCVPEALVSDAQKSLLAPCAGGYCAPDSIITSGGYKNPKTCVSIAGVEGRCTSTCLPAIQAQASLLPKANCATGEVCAPCYNPLAGDDYDVPTGACNLTCDAPAQPATKLSCPYTGTAIVDPTTLPQCDPSCGGAHCLPADLVPAAQRDLLAPCSGGYCLPDSFIRTGGLIKPTKCDSIAGVEGRCLSTCLPAVAEQAALLPSVGCPANQRCVPCYNPVSGDPTEATGACSVGCEDAPQEDPVILECPLPANAPDVLNPAVLPSCSPACNGAHCLPEAFVPVEQQALLAACPGGFCAPDDLIESGNLRNPKTCTSIAGAEGRCLSLCLPDVASQATLLPKSVCNDDQRCVPCYNPVDASPTVATGACSLGCDAPSSNPTIITCPWTGPDVINPTTLPGCNPICNGAHCMPAAFVPDDQKSLLATCSGGYCTPDVLIKTAGETKLPTCTAFSGTTAPGRCLSTCLPIVASQSTLEQSSCATGNKCAPCHDPFTGAATGACAIGCDTPPASAFRFSNCCNNTSLCIPNSQVTAGGQNPNDLYQEDCANSNFRCIDKALLPGAAGPRSCSSTFQSVGDCVSECMLSDSQIILLSLDADNCPSGYQCAPCGDVPGGC